MKLSVPFYKSKKDTDCGPLALKTALAYLGEEHAFEEIALEEKQTDSGLVWSIGIARASKKFGFPTKVVSINNFSHEESDMDYYKKYANNKAMIVLKELSEEIKKMNIEVQERDMSLEELLDYVSEKSIPIVLVNWYVIANKNGFSGHFLPVVGYDEKKVYVHNPGMANAMVYFPIEKEVFIRAWKSKGTDQDTIIIFRKN